jgi:serine/threonine protein kinase
MSLCGACGDELPGEATGGFCAQCVLADLLAEPVDDADSKEGSSEWWQNDPEFGDFEILAEIARGGMGAVYRARQRSLDRLVALKLVLGGVLAGEKAIQRFQIEASAIAKLDHPNIVPIYEFGEESGQPFFSMRLMEGGDLSGQIEALAGEPRKIAAIFSKLARALQFAHDQGILHRDLKPQNILLDRDGQPFITDFGLAKLEDDDLELTASKDLFGTPAFMAPEQADGGAAAVSPQTDVYGLGAVLYQLLTGMPPFTGKTSFAVLQQVVGQEPESPRRRRPDLDLDVDLELICLNCLRKEPDRRYASAAELADDLDSWLAGLPIRARQDDLPYRFRKWMGRNAGMVTVGCSVLVALMAILWIVFRPPVSVSSGRGFAIEGNGEEIMDGAAESKRSNGTRFEATPFWGAAVTNYFRIRKHGSNELSGELLSQVKFTGPAAADFSVVEAPAEILSPDELGRLGLRFEPRGLGLRRARVSLGFTNESDPGYTFAVGGSCFAKPGIVAATVKSKIGGRRADFAVASAVESRFGTSVVSLGDLDRNGVTDLLIGAPGSSGSYLEEGAVLTVKLDVHGRVVGSQRIDSTHGGFHGRLGARFGFGAAIAAPGDLDGDEVPDALVLSEGPRAESAEGNIVWQLTLRPDGTVKSQTKVALEPTRDAVVPTNRIWRVGSLSMAGDVNKDGYPDWVVGASPDSAVSDLVSVLSDSQASVVGTVVNPGKSAMPYLSVIEGAMCDLGDLNWDGFRDLAVGGKRVTRGQSEAPAVALASMDSSGRIRDYRPLMIDQYLGSDFAGKGGVGGLAPVGDLNGDGVNDLLVGAPGYNHDRGAIWFVLMGPDGSVFHMMRMDAPVGDDVDDQLKTKFGTSVAFLGDLDGNGLPEIAVGAPGDSGRGSLWIMEPQSSFRHEQGESAESGLRVRSGPDTIPFDVPWGGLSAGTFFGEVSVGAAWETNDLVIENIGGGTLELGGPSAPKVVGSDAGDFQIVQTPDSTLSSGESTRLSLRFVPTSGGHKWAQLEVGSILKNGRRAAIALSGIGRPESSVAQRIVRFPSRQRISHRRGGFAGDLAAGSGFGTVVASLGDVDGDGNGDLVVSANANQHEKDAIWILLLDNSGAVASQSKITWNDPVFRGLTKSDDGLGAAMTGPGDLNGDGVPDLLIMAPGDDDDRRNCGAIWLLHLNRDGSLGSARKLSSELVQPGEPAAERPGFGHDIAWTDLNGDGTGDLILGAPYGSENHFTAVLMGPDQTVSSVVRNLPDPSNGAGYSFGRSLAVLGDLDGDGTLEVATGTVDEEHEGIRQAKICILSLDRAGKVIRSKRLVERDYRNPVFVDAENIGFGKSLAAIGDVNHDGIEDLAIGADWARGGGRVWIACLDLSAEIIDLQVLDPPGQAPGGSRFGMSIAHVPGIGGTGSGLGPDRLAIGAPQQAEFGIRRGAVWMLETAADGPPWHRPDPPRSELVDSAGQLYGWGGQYGGNLSGPDQDRPTPRKLEWAAEQLIDLKVRTHVMAVLNGGSAIAWGRNPYGQLGNGKLTDRPAPGKILFPKGTPAMLQVVSGTTHSLSLDVEGNVWGWGGGSQFQLIGGKARSRPAKISFLADKKITMIAGGYWGGMAVDDAGQVWEWHPKVVRLVDGALLGKQVIAVAAAHSVRMALTDAGEVYSWPRGGEPVLAKGSLKGRVAVRIGATYDCYYVHTSDRRTHAWGKNTHGQLGIGSVGVVDESTEIISLRGEDIHSIAGGRNHVLMLTADDRVYGIGANGDGQLGNDDWLRDRSRPVLLDLKNVRRIAAGENASLAVVGGGASAVPSDAEQTRR